MPKSCVSMRENARYLGVVAALEFREFSGLECWLGLLVEVAAECTKMIFRFVLTPLS